MTSTPPKTKVRFYFADGLRGIAATWVVLFHIYAGGHLSNLDNLLPGFITTVLFKWGHLGVPIFFVLSGFVIAHSSRKSQITWSLFQNLSLRRLIRLSPPYYFSIVFVILFELTSAKIIGESYSLPSPGNLVTHLLYLQDIFRLEPINDIYWTLSLEMQFYLTFYILLGLSQWMERKLGLAYSCHIVFGSSMFVGALWPLNILPDNLFSGSFLSTWHGFVIGVFAYWAWQRKGYYRHMFYSYAGLLLISPIFSDVAATKVFLPIATITSAVISILLLEIGRADLMQSVLNWRWLQFLGLVSYSLYLFHNEISGIAFFVGYKILGQTLITEILGLFAVSALCVAFAAGAYWLLERPSIQWSHQLKQVSGNSNKAVGT